MAAPTSSLVKAVSFGGVDAVDDIVVENILLVTLPLGFGPLMNAGADGGIADGDVG